MKRARRTFSTEFKRRVVEEFLDGHASQAQLCRWHARPGACHRPSHCAAVAVQ